VYRALGFDELAIGMLAASLAVGGIVGAWPAARLAHALSRRAAILLGGVVTGAGIALIVTAEALALQLLAAGLVGAGGIVVYSSGSALLADATAGAQRARVFGQQVALGTVAAFVSAYVAGQLAEPIAALFGAPAASLLVLRVLVLLGGAVAVLSALPIFFVRGVPVRRSAEAVPTRRALLVRFMVVEAVFGFGAGSFIPFINLFLADRFGLAFAPIGLALGAIAVGGSLGALLHGIHLAPRLGDLRSSVLVQVLSIPFALAAALVPFVGLAVGALTLRAGLMYGSTSTYRAFQLSSFQPAERAGASALLSIAWSATAALGSVASGAVRSRLGDGGWTVNVATLALAYAAAATCAIVFFGRHEPRGDAAWDASTAATPHSASPWA
jgi:predicted MFS family arabinose efflux permease